MRLKRWPDTLTVIRTPLTVIFLTLLLLSCARDPLEGRLVLSGSSTLAPLITKAVAPWRASHPGVEVRVEAIGSDAGLERLIRFDDADLALLSRPLTESDVGAAASVGKVLISFPLAWDAVCLVVPASNTWVRSLTRSQAVAAFTTAVLWSDLDPAWPDTPLHRFVLGSRSGTSDVFSAALLGGDKGRLYAASAVQSSEDDRILARGISQVEGAIGFLGWTTMREFSPSLRPVDLDEVSPVASSIQDGTYGIPRQLWLVVGKTAWNSHPALRSLVQNLYTRYDELFANSPLIPLTEPERQDVERRASWPTEKS